MDKVFKPDDFSENSPYEDFNKMNSSQNGGVAIGRITNINKTKRIAEVKTFMGPPALIDLDIPDCKLIFPDAHINGSEFASLYQKNTIGLVFFIGGAVFFFGGIKPWNASTDGDVETTGLGDRLETEFADMEPGDRLISTRKGNFHAVLANGQLRHVAIEGLLLREYFPLGKLMKDVCSQYVRTWEGGEKQLVIMDPVLQMMMDYEEIRRDFYRTFIMTTEKGAVGLDGIYRRQMGVGIPAVPGIPLPIYEETLSILGEKSFTISPGGLPTVSVTYGPEGSLSVAIGAIQNFTIEVGPAGSFDLGVNNLLNIAIAELGDLEIVGPIGSVSMTAQGDVEVANAIGSLAMSAQGDFEVGNAVGTLSMDAQGNFEMAGATHTLSMNNGDVLLEEAVGGSLSLSKGKILLAAAAGEVLEQFAETLKGLDELLTALQAEQHVGNLGFPTAPPVNVADYIKSQVNFKKIAAVIDLMKG